jgi:hypothetical protein
MPDLQSTVIEPTKTPEAQILLHATELVDKLGWCLEDLWQGQLDRRKDHYRAMLRNFMSLRLLLSINTKLPTDEKSVVAQACELIPLLESRGLLRVGHEEPEV